MKLNLKSELKTENHIHELHSFIQNCRFHLDYINCDLCTLTYNSSP